MGSDTGDDVTVLEHEITSTAQLKELLKGVRPQVHVFGLGDVTVPISHSRALALWRIANQSGAPVSLVGYVLLFREDLYADLDRYMPPLPAED